MGKLSTGTAAAILALGYNGRISDFVKEHTSRHSHNTLKHDNKIDYDDNWIKINEWGKKFMEMNPQSIFHLEKDEKTNRSYIHSNLMYWDQKLVVPN